MLDKQLLKMVINNVSKTNIKRSTFFIIKDKKSLKLFFAYVEDK